MQSYKTHLIVFSLAVATLPGVTDFAVRADNFTWDNSCGDNTWHTCCDFWAGEDHYRDNNWVAGTPLWPTCPPFPGALDDVSVGADFVILGASASVNSFTSSGVFQFDAGLLSVAVDATYDGPVDWYGGGFSSGEHNVNAGIDISGTGLKSVHSGNVDSAGSTTWTGTGWIRIDSGPVFNNLSGATLDVQNDSTFDWLNMPIGVFDNAGTFTKSAGAGTTRVDYGLEFNNSGTVNIQTGTLELDGGGLGSGPFNMSLGADVEFDSSTYTLADGASLNGLGWARVTGGTVAVVADVPADNLSMSSGMLDIDAGVTLTAAAVEQSGGSVRGLGVLNATNSLTWTGGSMYQAGTTNVSVGAGLTIDGASIKTLSSSRVLDHRGSGSRTGTGMIRIDSGAVFNNLSGATFDVQNDSTFDHLYAPNGVFDNAGYFLKSAGPGTTRVDYGLEFNNSGTVELQGGTFDVDGGYTQTAGLTLLNDGDLSSNYTIDILGGVLAGSGTVDADVDSAGEVSPGLSAGTINITGDYGQFGGGELTIELAGTGTGQFDHLDITGEAALDGTLSVSLIEGFAPGSGDSFEIITCGSRVGEFATVNGWDSCIWALTVIYGDTSVTLSAVAGRGDFNGDGSVDLDDAGTLVDVLSGTNTDPDDVLMADMNCDGMSDGGDVQPFVDAVLGL